ncbi:hypothetical protein [Paenibacillus odorifer]|uniref:Pentapeptide repeat-containing protein n=1 Tax=Paenibacillus odorifer TaxID=189426 RepID=A0A1R0Y9M7_9BACL|nr:hypothetical protein [Paenibacillus odorifer]OMD44059.1 hypothetical protein BSK52_00470 [Paenibacillus odorifer]
MMAANSILESLQGLRERYAGLGGAEFAAFRRQLGQQEEIRNATLELTDLSFEALSGRFHQSTFSHNQLPSVITSLQLTDCEWRFIDANGCTSFEQVECSGTKFRDSRFPKRMQKCIFTDCEFVRITAIETEFDQVQFLNCKFDNCNFAFSKHAKFDDNCVFFNVERFGYED